MTVTLATFMEVLDTSIANVALPHIAGDLGRHIGRKHMGTDQLPGFERYHPANERLAFDTARAQALLHDLRSSVHFKFHAVRLGDYTANARALPRDAGPWRRRARAKRASHPGRHLFSEPAQHGIRNVRNGSRCCACHWPHAWRMDHRQLQLALDLLHQCPHRRHLAPAYPARGTRSAACDPRLRNRRGKNTDYFGITTIVIGVGLLQYVLDKGEELEWFDSNLIRVAFTVAAIALVAMIWREWTHKHPIIELRLLKKRNFASSVLANFTLGMVLNGSTILIPQFLQLQLDIQRSKQAWHCLPAESCWPCSCLLRGYLQTSSTRAR